MQNEKKPKLSAAEQIIHLKSKGVKFELISEQDAEKYLMTNNNYFKIRSYRKSFEKHKTGDQAGKYIDLDFAHLKDLAIIDMRLRYTLLLFALDIEHFEKVKLLKIISESRDDAYTVVKRYLKKLQNNEENNTIGKKPYTNLIKEINKNKSSEYCGALISNYSPNYPAWVFIEIIPFGVFIDFLGFCSEYFNDKNIKDDFYLLQAVKRLRNASAHNNCLINNLSLNTSQHRTNYSVNRSLSNEVKINKNSRDRRMSNASIRDIVTLLYAHKTIVSSSGVIAAQGEMIHDVINRCFRHIEYYKQNDLIVATFNFLKKVVDKYYDM